jgi:two-component system, OmpR family, sensor histidine kinase VanS
MLHLAPNRVLIRGDALTALRILWGVFRPAAASALAFLLVFGLLGGWLLAGRMLAPLTRITDATRMAANGSLSHRIRLQGRRDEFSELADAFDTMLARLEAHVVEQRRFAANASHELRTPLARCGPNACHRGDDWRLARPRSGPGRQRCLWLCH